MEKNREQLKDGKITRLKLNYKPECLKHLVEP